MRHSLDQLRFRSAQARRDILDLWRGNRAPLSGALSIVDLYVVLFFELMTEAEPDRPVRLVPKTTSANAVYAVARLAGWAPPAAPPSTAQLSTVHPPIPRRGGFGISASAHKLGTNLGQAVGHALHAKLRGRAQRTIVFLSDGELQCGVDHEAKLAAAWGLADLLLVVDLNGLQSSYRVGQADPTVIRDRDGRCEQLERVWRGYGWDYQEIDGHDHAAIHGALVPPAEPGRPGRPRVVVAHTVKGKGVRFIEDRLGYEHALDEAGFARAAAELDAQRDALRQAVHPPPPAGGDRGPAVASRTPRLPRGPFQTGTDRMRHTLGGWLAELRDRNPDLVYLLNSDNPIPFDRHVPVFDGGDPRQHIFTGINEPVAMSIARGMANEGALPIYLSPAAHLQSCGEELLHCGIDRQPVLVIGFYPGVDLAGWGASHAAYRDVSMFRSPGVTVYQPAGPLDLLLILTALYSDPGRLPAYLRMGRRGLPGLACPDGTREQAFRRGFYRVDQPLAAGGPADAVIFGSGTVMGECLAAAAELTGHGLPTAVINVLNLSRLDPESLARVTGTPRVCVSGIDADPFALAEPLYQALPGPLRAKLVPLGMTGLAQPRHRAAELAANGLDRTGIVARVRALAQRADPDRTAPAQPGRSREEEAWRTRRSGSG